MSKTKQHKKICEQLNKTYQAKNKDYGNSFDESIDEYGYIAFLVRASDKFKRMDQLIRTRSREVSDESLKDTLLDMANYCILMTMYLDNEDELLEKDNRLVLSGKEVRELLEKDKQLTLSDKEVREHFKKYKGVY